MRRSLVPGLVATLLAVAVPGAPAAPGADRPAGLPPDLDPLLEKLRNGFGLPGLSALVLRDGRAVAQGAVGARGIFPKLVPLGRRDRMHLGSCGKALTAALVARLVEKGTLRFDLRLDEGLPELVERMHPDYRAVTLEMLLLHRGGVPGGLEEIDPELWAGFFTSSEPPRRQRERLALATLARAPGLPPGQAWAYSNLGYALVGHVAESRTGIDFEELMRREVFGPLGMEGCGFGAPGSRTKLDEPWGHRRTERGLEPVPPWVPGADNPPAIAPAGTVHCRFEDWGRFVLDQLAGARGVPGHLGVESYRRLHLPEPAHGYAMGWIVADRPWAGGKAMTHTGSNNRSSAVVWMAPARDLAILVAANAGIAEAGPALDAVVAILIVEAGLMAR